MRPRSVIATPDFVAPPAPRGPGRSPSASRHCRPPSVRDEACPPPPPPQVPRSRPGTPRTSRAPTPERAFHGGFDDGGFDDDVAAVHETLQHRSVSCVSSTSGWDDAHGMNMARVRHARRRGSMAAPPLATPALDDDADAWGAPVVDGISHRRGDGPSDADGARRQLRGARPVAPPLVTPASPTNLERLLFVDGRWVAASVADWRALYPAPPATAGAPAPHPENPPSRSGAANSTTSAPTSSATPPPNQRNGEPVDDHGLVPRPDVVPILHRSVSAQTDAASPPVLRAFAVERDGIRPGDGRSTSITTVSVSEPRRRQH